MIETVIVAHGLWMPGVETGLLRHRLKAAGFQAELFRFATLRATLTQNRRALQRYAEQVRGDRLHFVGYSLGGIVTLAMLAEARLPRLGRVVCLGSPLTGSRAAASLSRTSLGQMIVGRSLLEHVSGGGIDHWEAGAELGIIAGTRSLGIGRMLQSLPGENDGTVLVDETRLPGATAHLTLPVTHSQLLFDRVVARQTIHFLKHGKFAG